MSVSTLREEAERRLRTLSDDRLRVVLDFLSYLEDRESSEATAELLAIPGFEQAFQRAVAQADAGEVVRWAEVRRDV
jgi:hypothetical protein